MATKAELEKELESLYFKEKERIDPFQASCFSIIGTFLLSVFLYTVLPHGNINVTFKLQDASHEYGDHYLGKYQVCREEEGKDSYSHCGILQEYGAALSDFNDHLVRDYAPLEVSENAFPCNQWTTNGKQYFFKYCSKNGGK